jgi:hypothetical protein
MVPYRSSVRHGVGVLPSRRIVFLSVLLIAARCAYSGQTQVFTQIAPRPGPIPLALAPCTDRTGTTVRNVAADATTALAKELAVATGFSISSGRRYKLNCGANEFVVGSAVQRWVMRG